MTWGVREPTNLLAPPGQASKPYRLQYLPLEAPGFGGRRVRGGPPPLTIEGGEIPKGRLTRHHDPGSCLIIAVPALSRGFSDIASPPEATRMRVATSSLPSAPRVRVIHPDTATGPVQPPVNRRGIRKRARDRAMGPDLGLSASTHSHCLRPFEHDTCKNSWGHSVASSHSFDSWVFHLTFRPILRLAKIYRGDLLPRLFFG